MIHIYTDGGCSGNPGPGGWAYVIIRDWGCGIAASGTGDLGNENWEQGNGNVNGEQEPVILAEKWGAERATTNNRMELQAVIAALESFPAVALPATASGEKVNVYTDSQYVQKGISLWINDWKRKGWKTSDKKPVKNQDLWQRLDALAAGLELKWVWVKGHAGNRYNERCDVMTRKAIVSLQN